MDTLFPQTGSNLCRVCAEPVVDGRWNYCSERCRNIANAVSRPRGAGDGLKQYY
ncbi:hypothetical protein [Natrinema soli]|uniref:DUF2116 family Zn-ribbon domain-containing protein n=1 Tax=Natrinema soli TaxID=1930624 RepID=A0ABD5SP67_9EURY|nr:hypothetical protein [Natrinema soli]